MGGDGNVGDAQKALGHDAGHLKTIEVSLLYFPHNSLQRLPDLGHTYRTEERRLHFAGQEEEIPPGGVDLVIQSKAVQSPNHAPMLEVWFTLQGENPRRSEPCRLERVAS